LRKVGGILGLVLVIERMRGGVGGWFRGNFDIINGLYWNLLICFWPA